MILSIYNSVNKIKNTHVFLGTSAGLTISGSMTKDACSKIVEAEPAYTAGITSFAI